MAQFVILPTPNSWYAVCFSSELKTGSVLSRQLANREIVVFRTQSGHACVMDAHCPHLGAHLGLGGTVTGEAIRCPFHHFCFDTSGECVATGYGTKPPPTARAKVWPLREIGGIVFAYFDSQDAAPTWEPPALDTAGWTMPIFETFDLTDHPQETVENGVDIGHFAIVHGYSHVQMRKELEIDGAMFSIAYAARRPMPYLGRFGAYVNFDFDLSIYGMGYSLVTVSVPQFGVTARLFVLARPTVGERRIDLILALSMREIEQSRQVHPLAAIVPRKLLTRFLARTIHWGLINDAKQDFVIWQNKRYLHPPALAEGDGPIGKFRQWARQFYYEDITASGSTNGMQQASQDRGQNGGRVRPAAKREQTGSPS